MFRMKTGPLDRVEEDEARAALRLSARSVRARNVYAQTYFSACPREFFWILGAEVFLTLPKKDRDGDVVDAREFRMALQLLDLKKRVGSGLPCA